MGRLKSCKSKSFGLMEAVALKCELLVKVVEVGEFLIIFVVVVKVGNDTPVVEGNGLSMEVLVGPLAAGLNGVEEPGASGCDRECGVARGGKDFLDIFLFILSLALRTG